MKVCADHIFAKNKKIVQLRQIQSVTKKVSIRMIEVELKVLVNDRKQLNDKLLKLGFVKEDRVKETDTYFDNQINQIKDSDGALRVRSCENLT